MATYYPEMAGFLASYLTIKTAGNIPVYGLPGGALEYYANVASQKLINLVGEDNFHDVDELSSLCAGLKPQLENQK